MKTWDRNELLRSRELVLALALLFLNDFFFKPLFHNWFTGKLSDFAGLFAFALFWRAIFPDHKRIVVAIAGIAFVVWKSSLSDGFIHSWNGLAPFSIGRTVDYTDLLALGVLPFALCLRPRPAAVLTSRTATLGLSVIALFLFCATSYRNNTTRLDTGYEYHTTLPVVRAILDSVGARRVGGTWEAEEYAIWNGATSAEQRKLDHRTYFWSDDSLYFTIKLGTVDAEAGIVRVELTKLVLGENSPDRSPQATFEVLFADKIPGYIGKYRLWHGPVPKRSPDLMFETLFVFGMAIIAIIALLVVEIIFRSRKSRNWLRLPLLLLLFACFVYWVVVTFSFYD